jgi:hypothetical protein
LIRKQVDKWVLVQWLGEKPHCGENPRDIISIIQEKI